MITSTKMRYINGDDYVDKTNKQNYKWWKRRRCILLILIIFFAVAPQLFRHPDEDFVTAYWVDDTFDVYQFSYTHINRSIVE